MRWAWPLLMLCPGPLAADEISDFLGQQGCVIGPESAARAMEAGIDPDAVTGFVAELAPGATGQQGEWLVLGAEVCDIGLPVIDSVLAHEDPEVQAAWSAPNAYLDEFGAFGCYLNHEVLTVGVMASRGWTEAEAFNAYLSYLTAGIVSGDIRFFSDDPLRTPIGPRLMIGDCAVGDDLAEIGANHAVLRAALGPFVRDVAPQLRCGVDQSILDPWPRPDIEALTGMANTNAHLDFEFLLIAIGAGWVERDLTDIRDRGTLRPPTCVYEQ